MLYANNETRVVRALESIAKSFGEIADSLNTIATEGLDITAENYNTKANDCFMDLVSKGIEDGASALSDGLNGIAISIDNISYKMGE